MKKILIPVFALALLGSCDVLDKQPLPSIAPENFFQNADDAEAAITAAYDALQATGLYSQDLVVVGEMPSDNCTSTNGDVTTLDRINWTPTTSQVNNIWRASYIGINRANAVLKYVPNVNMPAERKNQILGEAYFLRALHYYNLVKLYGAVPLRLEPTETGDPAVVALPRTSSETVYAQIVTDLTTADGLAPATNTNRITKGAVNALLAKVYLTQRQWAQAVTAANKVISSGTYSLLPNFKGLFPAENKAPETILEVQNQGNADGNNILPDLLLPSPPATYSFPKFNIPTAELLQFADTSSVLPGGTRKPNADKRWTLVGRTNAGRDYASFVYSTSSTANDRGAFVYKWPGAPNAFNSPDNTYILRYADVLLIYAEAANEQGGPSADVLDKLNLIRTRAGLLPLTSASPQYASKKAMRDEIDRQRRLELAFEGERWYDLLRYARHNQVEAGAHTITALDLIQEKLTRPDVNYLLFPIPQGEINNNAQLQQNPGY
ncbi:RagB/SusD family nutrient uptake outer membrane protein [Hymenobacter wooponensis]|uniref:RagB/SusD family nutrient uptake outer membrane protein n=1 Tax=Hymenobacter wooponensis TaxID=1525360 RepID=A0A4Z0MHG4_9BACT|nr:RagB/SusD family nutrient uptake outer membrane protein [Hymenobacter wooponensis]TGD78790.1 RagB/SusD family nutrient uptake outer membrane protein [Hymenobacter wooponensis]